MAVYGIGLIIRLLEELQKQDFDPLGTRPSSDSDSLLIQQLGEAMERGRRQGTSAFGVEQLRALQASGAPKKKRRPSAYSKRYGKAFKKLAPKFKKKNGGWKKNGFKRCQAAAHKEARKK